MTWGWEAVRVPCRAAGEAEQRTQHCRAPWEGLQQGNLLCAQGEWGTCWWGSPGCRGSCPELPGHHPSSSKLVPQGQCKQGHGTAPSTKPLCAIAGCAGGCGRARRGLCAACSFVSVSCCRCRSAFAASSTRQLSRIVMCFSFFQENRLPPMCLVQFPRVVSQSQL